MKTTPGPWHIWKEDIGREKNQRISGANGFCLAIAYGDGEPGEVSSNARLIAAAPEILHMLKELHAYLSVSSDSYRASVVQEKVEALLAKIDGGE